MSKQGSDFYENFTKDIYKTIKGFGDDERGSYIIHTYENLYGKLKTDEESEGVVVDLAKLREDLSHVRGIGGQRLDEIMAVIERHLTPSVHNDTPLGRADGIDSPSDSSKDSDNN